MATSVLASGNANIDQADHRRLNSALTNLIAEEHRTGVFPDASPAQITNSSAMVAGIQPFRCMLPALSGQGNYLAVFENTELVTFDPGEASVVRNDRIIARIYDDSLDSSGISDALVEYLKGQASGAATDLPDGSILLWEVPVPAGASAGSGGIDFASIATDERQYVTAAGGIIPVTDSDQLTALDTGAPEGTAAYVRDIDMFMIRDAGTFRSRGQTSVANYAALADIPNPWDGMLVTVRSTGSVYQRISGAWVPMIAQTAFQAIGTAATTDLTLTTTEQDVPGTSVAFTTLNANAKVLIVATFDMNADVFTAANVIIGLVNVDGVDLSRQSLYEVNHSTARATMTRTFEPIILASAGAHTIKLRGKKTTSSNTLTINGSPHTAWNALVIDMPT